MGFGTEHTSYIIRHIHSIATLVVENNAVPAGTHATIDTEGGSDLAGQISVVAIEACRSSAN